MHLRVMEFNSDESQVGSVGGKLQVTQVTSTADAKADGEVVRQNDTFVPSKRRITSHMQLSAA